jgi:5-amino-6-(5-phosphoribosylamino)uracil reductase
MSADGKIGTAAFDHVAIGSSLDRDVMSVLRAQADAIVVGGRTFRNWPLPLVPDPAAIVRARQAGYPMGSMAPLEGRTWWNVIVTRTLDLPAEARFWQDPRVKPLVITAAPVGARALPSGEVEHHPEVTVPVILDALRARGCKSVLVEAGGDLIYQFLAEDAVDEVCLTICPVLVGGAGAPTPVDGPGFPADALRRLRLARLDRLGDELYCRYAVVRSADRPAADRSPDVGAPT